MLPNGQLIIPDAGHFLLNHDPSRLISVVSNFFDSPTSAIPLATIRTGYQPGRTR